MSTGPNERRRVPTTGLPGVQTDVPAGEFCGLCGCHLTRGAGTVRLVTNRGIGAAPGEHLLLPSLASSLFPHLPQRSRTPFRVGLAVVLLALVAFALLRMPAPLIAVAALGLPLLFLIYLREADAFRDLPPATGAHRGVGCRARCRVGAADRCDGRPLLRRPAGRRRRGVPHAARRARHPARRRDLMLVPAVVVRLLRPPTREALDGFMIGALGALTFTAAATLTRLAPQFATGLVSKRPIRTA